MEYYTSDLHFFHKNILRYTKRPFKSLDEMHEALIKNWNEVVKDEDTVYVLGDFAFCGKTKAKEILSKLKGHKHLVIGNHDLHIKPIKWVELGFESVHKSFNLQDNIWLSHYPFKHKGDNNYVRQRFATDRLVDDGNIILLHGHVHNSWRRKGRMINVGVDQWDYRPVTLKQLLACPNDPKTFKRIIKDWIWKVKNLWS